MAPRRKCPAIPGRGEHDGNTRIVLRVFAAELGGDSVDGGLGAFSETPGFNRPTTNPLSRPDCPAIAFARSARAIAMGTKISGV